MVTAMQMDRMDCSVFSQLPSKMSGLAALAFLISLPPASACMLVRNVNAPTDVAWEANWLHCLEHPTSESAGHYWSPGAVQPTETYYENVHVKMGH